MVLATNMDTETAATHHCHFDVWSSIRVLLQCVSSQKPTFESVVDGIYRTGRLVLEFMVVAVLLDRVRTEIVPVHAQHVSFEIDEIVFGRTIYSRYRYVV